ncbi:MAG: hypothetical protein PUG60_10440 [Lachnospiraceae bacterium]|nr:hypothetical protein [Lachnospiraceae bacterium]MDY4968763.1 hypothetical protein [Lachnospiraceae bacterium]
MEQYHQITITEYLSWKEEIKERLSGAAENFVVVGYRLKQIRDTEAYKTDGYDTMGAFVRAEYGLNEATASKFMRINDVYSEGGNSMYLQEQYRGFEYNKLYEMIALPLEDKKLITSDMSVRDIRELKAFNKDARAAGNMEPEAISYQIPEDEKALYLKLMQENEPVKEWILSGEGNEKIDDILDELAPSGSRTIRKGLLILLLKSKQEGVVLKRVQAGMEQISYSEWFERVREILMQSEADKEELKANEESGGFDVENENNAEAEIITGPAEQEVNEQDTISEFAESVIGKPENVMEIAENVIKKTENVIETAESVPELPINVPVNTDPVPETAEETVTECHELEPEQPAEKTMIRYEYILDLTPSGMASYLYNNLPRTALSARNAKIVKSWLNEMVDEKGRTYSS